MCVSERACSGVLEKVFRRLEEKDFFFFFLFFVDSVLGSLPSLLTPLILPRFFFFFRFSTLFVLPNDSAQHTLSNTLVGRVVHAAKNEKVKFLASPRKHKKSRKCLCVLF